MIAGLLWSLWLGSLRSWFRGVHRPDPVASPSWPTRVREAAPESELPDHDSQELRHAPGLRDAAPGRVRRLGVENPPRTAVAEEAYAQGLAREPRPADLERAIAETMYDPRFEELERHSPVHSAALALRFLESENGCSGSSTRRASRSRASYHGDDVRSEISEILKSRKDVSYVQLSREIISSA